MAKQPKDFIDGFAEDSAPEITANGDGVCVAAIREPCATSAELEERERYILANPIDVIWTDAEGRDQVCAPLSREERSRFANEFTDEEMAVLVSITKG
jgi:hypothetical protein